MVTSVANSTNSSLRFYSTTLSKLGLEAILQWHMLLTPDEDSGLFSEFIAVMQELPSELLSRLRRTLTSCEEFDTQATLQAVFAVNDLQPFQDGLPEASSKKSRAELLINYLRPKQTVNNRSALIIFLQELVHRYGQNDVRQTQLSELIQELQSQVSNQYRTASPSCSSEAGKKQLFPANLTDLARLDPDLASIISRRKTLDNLQQRLVESATTCKPILVAVLGPSRIGRSTLLENLCEHEAILSCFIPLYLRCQSFADARTKEELYEHLGTLIYDQFTNFAYRNKNTISISNIDPLSEFDLDALLRWLKKLRSLAGKRILCIFDDLELYLSRDQPLDYSVVALISSITIHYSMVITQPYSWKRTDNKIFQYLIGKAEHQITVNPYPDGTVERVLFILKMYVDIENEVCDYLIWLCDGQPLLVNDLVCSIGAMTEYSTRNETCRPSITMREIKRKLRELDERLTVFWNLLDESAQTVIRLIIAESPHPARNKIRLSQLKHRMETSRQLAASYSEDCLRIGLNTLSRFGYVELEQSEDEDECYRFKLGALLWWARHNVPRYGSGL